MRSRGDGSEGQGARSAATEMGGAGNLGRLSPYHTRRAGRRDRQFGGCIGIGSGAAAKPSSPRDREDQWFKLVAGDAKPTMDGQCPRVPGDATTGGDAMEMTNSSSCVYFAQQPLAHSRSPATAPPLSLNQPHSWGVLASWLTASMCLCGGEEGPAGIRPGGFSHNKRGGCAREAWDTAAKCEMIGGRSELKWLRPRFQPQQQAVDQSPQIDNNASDGLQSSSDTRGQR